MLRLIVVGSAAGGGFPQWNSNDPASQRARGGDPAAPAENPILHRRIRRRFATGCCSTLRRICGNRSTAPRPSIPRNGKRDSPICSVVLTNGDVDHVAGLLTLRESPSLLDLCDWARACRCCRPTASSTSSTRNWWSAGRCAWINPSKLRLATASRPASSSKPFAVPGKVALYLENAAAGPNFGTQAEDTIGLEDRVRATARRISSMSRAAPA